MRQLRHLCGEYRPAQPAAAADYPRNSVVRHPDRGQGTVMSVEQDRLTVLFDEQGYNTLSLPWVRDHNLLTTDDK